MRPGSHAPREDSAMETIGGFRAVSAGLATAGGFVGTVAGPD